MHAISATVETGKDGTSATIDIDVHGVSAKVGTVKDGISVAMDTDVN